MSGKIQKLILRVSDKNGLYKTMAVDKSTTAANVCAQFAKKIFNEKHTHPDPSTLSLVVMRGEDSKTVLSVNDRPYYVLLEAQMNLNPKASGPQKFFIQDASGNLIEFATPEQVALWAATASVRVKDQEAEKEVKKKIQPPAEARNMQGYMQKKMKGGPKLKFQQTWVVFKLPSAVDPSAPTSPTLFFYVSDTDTEPLQTVEITNALIDVIVDQRGKNLQITVPTGDRYTLTHDEVDVVQDWTDNLLLATKENRSSTVLSMMSRRATLSKSLMPVAVMGASMPGLKKDTVDSSDSLKVQHSMVICLINYFLSQRGIKLFGYEEAIEKSKEIKSSEESENAEKVDGVNTDKGVLCRRIVETGLLFELLEVMFGEQVPRSGSNVTEEIVLLEDLARVIEALKEEGVSFPPKCGATELTKGVATPKAITTLLFNTYIAFVATPTRDREYAIKENILKWVLESTDYQKNLPINTEKNEPELPEKFSQLNIPEVLCSILRTFKPDLMTSTADAFKRKSKQSQMKTVWSAISSTGLPVLVEASDVSSMDERCSLACVTLFYLSFDPSNKMKWDGLEHRRSHRLPQKEVVKKVKEEKPAPVILSPALLYTLKKNKTSRDSTASASAEPETESDVPPSISTDPTPNLEAPTSDSLTTTTSTTNQNEPPTQTNPSPVLPVSTPTINVEDDNSNKNNDTDKTDKNNDSNNTNNDSITAPLNSNLLNVVETKARSSSWMKANNVVPEVNIPSDDSYDEEDIDTDDTDIDGTKSPVSSSPRQEKYKPIDPIVPQQPTVEQNQNPPRTRGASSLQQGVTPSTINYRASWRKIDGLDIEDNQPPILHRKSQETVVTTLESDEKSDSSLNINNNNNVNSNSNTNTNTTTATDSEKTGEKNGSFVSAAPTPRRRGRIVVRVCLEGFGPVLFRSFAIDPKASAGDLARQVSRKIGITDKKNDLGSEYGDYGIFVVKDAMERLLEEDEEILTAESDVERFVYKKNDCDATQRRKFILSKHR